jgi:hypothetical protein
MISVCLRSFSNQETPTRDHIVQRNDDCNAATRLKPRRPLTSPFRMPHLEGFSVSSVAPGLPKPLPKLLVPANTARTPLRVGSKCLSRNAKITKNSAHLLSLAAKRPPTGGIPHPDALNPRSSGLFFQVVFFVRIIRIITMGNATKKRRPPRPSPERGARVFLPVIPLSRTDARRRARTMLSSASQGNGDEDARAPA